MNSRNLRSLLFVLAVVLATVPLHAAHSTKSLITLDPPGSIDTRPFGISATGDIVGLYFTADGKGHGFLLTRGVYTSIDVPGAIRTNAVGITVLNSRRSDGDDHENEMNPACGERAVGRDAEKHDRRPCRELAVVGRYDTPDGRMHGYLLSGRTLTTIDFPGATFTTATGINPSGHIVGRYRSPDGVFHGFTLIDGDFATIDYPGAVSIQGMAINADGDIAGYYVDTDGVFHGFLLSGGTFTTVDPPDSIATGELAGVIGINRRAIVGCYGTVTGGANRHGFVFRNGTYTSFDFPGAISTSNSGINARGDIVGIYADATGRRHGFLAPKGAER